MLSKIGPNTDFESFEPSAVPDPFVRGTAQVPRIPLSVLTCQVYFPGEVAMPVASALPAGSKACEFKSAQILNGGSN